MLDKQNLLARLCSIRHFSMSDFQSKRIAFGIRSAPLTSGYLDFDDLNPLETYKKVCDSGCVRSAGFW